MQIEFPNLQGIYCLLHWEGKVSWRLEWGCGEEPNEPGNFDPLNSDESSLPIRNSLSTPSEAALLPLSERSNPPTLAEETVRTSPEAVAVKDFWLSSGPPTYPSTHNSPTYTHNTHTHTLFVLDLQWDSSLESFYSLQMTALKQLLVCYWVLVGTECFTMNHKVAILPELPSINWALCDTPSHNVEWLCTATLHHQMEVIYVIGPK